MNDILTLLKPRIWPLTNRSARMGKNGEILKLCILAVIGMLFWSAIFVVAVRVLTYFRSIEEIGDILGYKLLSMILIVAYALLIFSSILTSLSRLYLSRDLVLVHSMPIASYKIFIARWLDSTVESAWMVVIFTLPIFLSYGIVYRASVFYYANTLLVLAPLVVNASAVSTILVMLAVIVIPANRLKSIFIFLGILFFVVIYLAIRLSRPELLVDPEVFDTVMVYITSLQTPLSPILPSTWAYDSIRAGLSGELGRGLFHTGLAWSFAGTIVFILIMVADSIYFKGFSKTQTAAARLFKKREPGRQYLNFLPGPVKSFAIKEIKTFLRDQTQWSQLFLIAALVVIYVYNFKVLPIEKSPIKTVYLQNLFSFLNMGLALFVLTAISARFAYPAVSMEREAFWLVRTSPLSLQSFLWIKFFIYYLPLLLLTEILIVATNILLAVTPFMMVLSIITVIEAGPVYHIFMAHIHGRTLSPVSWLWIIGSFSAAFMLSILAIALPMRFGENRLSKLQI
jgi:ABC-2 type transport system permease protein